LSLAEPAEVAERGERICLPDTEVTEKRQKKRKDFFVCRRGTDRQKALALRGKTAPNPGGRKTIGKKHLNQLLELGCWDLLKDIDVQRILNCRPETRGEHGRESECLGPSFDTLRTRTE